MAQNAADSYAADDFVVPAAALWQINGVDVDGEYRATTTTFPTGFHVHIYTNTGSNLPGTLVTERLNQPFVQGPAAGDAVISIASARALGPGTYWMSVRARQDFFGAEPVVLAQPRRAVERRRCLAEPRRSLRAPLPDVEPPADL